jgi:hypothetical protein
VPSTRRENASMALAQGNTDDAQALALEDEAPYAPRDAPRLDVRDDHNVIDGVPLRGGDVYNVLKNKRELWKQLNPGRRFLGVLTMNPAGLATVFDLEARLASAYRAGYPGIDILFTRTHTEPGEPPRGRLYALSAAPSRGKHCR